MLRRIEPVRAPPAGRLPGAAHWTEVAELPAGTVTLVDVPATLVPAALRMHVDSVFTFPAPMLTSVMVHVTPETPFEHVACWAVTSGGLV